MASPVFQTLKPLLTPSFSIYLVCSFVFCLSSLGVVFEGVRPTFFPTVAPSSGRDCLLGGAQEHRLVSEHSGFPGYLTCPHGDSACCAVSTPLPVVVAALCEPGTQLFGIPAAPRSLIFCILTRRGPLHLLPPSLFRHASNVLYQINFMVPSSAKQSQWDFNRNWMENGRLRDLTCPGGTTWLAVFCFFVSCLLCTLLGFIPQKSVSLLFWLHCKWDFAFISQCSQKMARERTMVLSFRPHMGTYILDVVTTSWRR